MVSVFDLEEMEALELEKNFENFLLESISKRCKGHYVTGIEAHEEPETPMVDEPLDHNAGKGHRISFRM